MIGTPSQSMTFSRVALLHAVLKTKRGRHLQPIVISHSTIQRAVMKEPPAQPQRVSWQMNSSRQALIQHSRSRNHSTVTILQHQSRPDINTTSIYPAYINRPVSHTLINQQPGTTILTRLTNGTTTITFEKHHTLLRLERHTLPLTPKRTLNHFFNVSFENHKHHTSTVRRGKTIPV